MNKQKEKFWNEVFFSGKNFMPMNTILLDKILERLHKNLKRKINNALDLGCGTGDLAVKLARRGVKATAVDVSSVALVKTNERLTKEKPLVRSRIKLEQFDIDKEDWQLKEKFDAVFAKLLFYTIKNKGRFLGQVKKIINEQGTLILITPLIIPRAKQSSQTIAISVAQRATEVMIRKYFSQVELFQIDYSGEDTVRAVYLCFN